MRKKLTSSPKVKLEWRATALTLSFFHVWVVTLFETMHDVFHESAKGSAQAETGRRQRRTPFELASHHVQRVAQLAPLPER